MIEEHEEQLVDTFRHFNRLERALRQAISKSLSRQLGASWIRQAPTSMVEKWRETMLEALEQDDGPERDENLIDFADFSELASLVVDHFWGSAFENLLGDLEITKGRFDQIRRYRNSLMHSVLKPKLATVGFQRK